MAGSVAVDFDELAGYVPEIERELERSYARERAAAEPRFAPYLERLREFTLRGGKRFRALLLLAGYHLATGRAPRPALPAAAALEHFQSWMLVHDDIIDHSEERRGGRTVHLALADEHRATRGLGDAEAYGVGVGITLGDLEEPFTVGALLQGRADARRRLAALNEYVRMTRDTAFGQLLDIRNGAVEVGEVSESDVLLVHRLKSAVYTVASPLRIGAMLGGARKGLLDVLESSGLDLGVAFQLRDDVLGTGLAAGSPGKSANDLVEGKRTLLVVRAWAAGSSEDRGALARVLGVPGAPEAEVAAAQEAIRRSGSLAYSEQRIRELSDRALRRVRASRDLTRAGKLLLEEIAGKLVYRAV